MTLGPFPTICPAPLASYGPGQPTTAEAFSTQFLQGPDLVGQPLTLSWAVLHHTLAAQVWAHQQASRGGALPFLLPSAAWADDHPDVASDLWWRYAPGSPISEAPATSGGAFVSLSVSLILATP
jgi:hypothetical protein